MEIGNPKGLRGYISAILTVAAASLFCVFFAVLSAYGAVELPEERVIGAVVYGEDEDKYLSPGAVTVIRPEEYMGELKSLPDLLENAPGLRIIRLQGRHGYAVASIRGSTSSQVAVYVDGVLMNLQSESAVDLSSIPADNVERVEVYRGYIPARFGAQAMGGVINIVTRSPMKPETDVSLGAGSFGRFKGTVSHSATLGEGRFFGSFGYEGYDGGFKYWNDNGTPYNDTDDYTGRRRGGEFEKMDLLLKWEDSRWRARASWVRRDRGLPLAAPGLDREGEWQRPHALLETTRFDLSLARDQSATVGNALIDWGWELSYTGQEKEYDSRRGSSLSQIGGMNVTRSEYDTSRWAASFNASWAAGERHFVEFLGEYSDERLDVDGDMVYEYLNGISRYSYSGLDLGLLDTIALDSAGSLLATPSARWHKQDGEDRLTWQIALTKEFSSAWMLKSAYGTYSRAPNMYELYGDGAFILPAARGLEWESGTQFDVGIIWTGARKREGAMRSSASLSAFWRDSDNLIELDMESPRFSRYRNIARADVRGMELEAAFDWERWDLSLSATWMEGRNKTPGEEGSVRFYGKALPNRPEWSGVARLTRGFVTAGGRGGSLFVEYQYVGENYADSSEKVLFDARNIWNIGIRYDLSPTTRLVAGVDDVFNDSDGWRMRSDGFNGPSRMLWYPTEGRTYYITLNL
ncbi:MAG: TonB-dependent receptor [Synergistaceae bacterium]|nr:TonB-dependent receptor [Synergistaceae bacterium]